MKGIKAGLTRRLSSPVDRPADRCARAARDGQVSGHQPGRASHLRGPRLLPSGIRPARPNSCFTFFLTTHCVHRLSTGSKPRVFRMIGPFGLGLSTPSGYVISLRYGTDRQPTRDRWSPGLLVKRRGSILMNGAVRCPSGTDSNGAYPCHQDCFMRPEKMAIP